MKRDGNGSVGYRSSTLTSKKIKLFPCLSVSLCVYLCLCLSVSVCLSLSLIFYCLICWVYAHMCNSYVCMTLWTHYVFVLIFSFFFVFCFFKFSMYSPPPPALPPPPLLLTIIKDYLLTTVGLHAWATMSIWTSRWCFPLSKYFPVQLFSGGVAYFHRWIRSFLDFTVPSTGQDEQTLFKIAHSKYFHSKADHIVKKEASLQFWMEHKSTEFRMR